MGRFFRIMLFLVLGIVRGYGSEFREIGSYGGREMPSPHFRTYRKYQGRTGTFYLFDLERNGRFFNALLYRSLQVEGVSGSWHVALADWRMAKREANLKLGENRKSFPLAPMALRMDLQRVKYVVVFTEKPVKELGIRFVDLLPRPVKNRKMHLASWVWKGEHLTAEILKSWGIDRIYLQHAPEFTRTVLRWKKEMKSLNIYAVSGTAGEIYRPRALIRRWQNLPWNKLEGVQLDVEPYLLPEYRDHPAETLHHYLKFVREVGTWVHQKGKKLSLAVPFWFQNILLNGNPLLREIFRVTDEVVVMSYRNQAEEVLNLSRVFLRWGEITGKRVSIGIELLPLRREESLDGICATEHFYHLRCRDTEVHEGKISFAGHPDRFKQMLLLPVPAPSFDRLVLHDLSALKYFKNPLIKKKAADIHPTLW